MSIAIISSMNNDTQARPIGPFAQWLLRPLGWPLYIPAGIASAYVLASDVAPGGYTNPAFIAILLWLVIDFIWIVHVSTQLIVALVHRKPLDELSGGWKPWLMIPLLQVVLLVITSMHVPFYTGFLVSRPAMERLALQVKDSSSFNDGERTVGLYRTDGMTRLPWGIRFRVIDAGFLETTGFAYSYKPGGAPKVEETGDNFGRYTYTRILGNWYQWNYSEDW